MRATIYNILSTVAFGIFCWAYIKTGIPHLPALMFAMYFSLMARTEGKE